MSAVAASQGAHQDVPLVGLAAFLVAVLAPASVGLFVALRRPGNRVAWILLAGPLSVAVVMTAGAIAALALHEHPDSTLGAWATLVGTVFAHRAFDVVGGDTVRAEFDRLGSVSVRFA